MSLYGVMRTGVSGMNAQSNKLSTVSDNIANVNTTGYKRASTEFSSLILKSGSGNYDSGAVETSVRYAISDAGNWLRNEAGEPIKRLRHVCWDGCMFSNEIMMKPQTWNDILGVMVKVRDRHGWQEAA